MTEVRTVRDARELRDALAEGATDIEVSGTIRETSLLELGSGVHLHGGCLELGPRGILLGRDSTLQDIELRAPETGVAVQADVREADWGTLTLRRVRTTGRVALIADGAVATGHLEIDGLTVHAADLRERPDDVAPAAPGCADLPRFSDAGVMPGALTIWNRRADPSVQITASLTDIAIGSSASPVRGSGVLLGGRAALADGAEGGTLRLAGLSTGAVSCEGDGASGLLVLPGALIGILTCTGPVGVRGRDSVALRSDGDVMMWSAQREITAHGPGSIAMLSSGSLGTLEIDAPIRADGEGAQGMVLDGGSLIEADLATLHVSGAGSTGVRLARHLPTLSIRGDLRRDGDPHPPGDDAVASASYGAAALHVQRGGGIEVLEVDGKIRASGDHVPAVVLEGKVGSWDVREGISATGAGADAVQHRAGIEPPSGLDLHSADGADVSLRE
jgi:hypothetical protein